MVILVHEFLKLFETGILFVFLLQEGDQIEG